MYSDVENVAFGVSYSLHFGFPVVVFKLASTIFVSKCMKVPSVSEAIWSKSASNKAVSDCIVVLRLRVSKTFISWANHPLQFRFYHILWNAVTWNPVMMFVWFKITSCISASGGFRNKISFKTKQHSLSYKVH